MDHETWTPEEALVLSDLGPEEITRRVELLSKHDTYDTIAYINYDVSLTPEQMIAFAHFAQSAGPDALMADNAIKTLKPMSERVRLVLARELRNRKEEASE